MPSSVTSSPKAWDAAQYDRRHSYVWRYGAALIDLLAPQPGERILDLGCGTGHLTQQISAAGATVVGLDADAAMIAQARQNYAQLEFMLADARNFNVEPHFDAVFSNAALHWVQDPDAAIACIAQALKLGGRFVAELGGFGNIRALLSALYKALNANGISHPEQLNPWFFPTVGDYASRLEQQGFEVTYGALIDRPTPLEGGEAGLRNWFQMFASRFLAAVTEEQRSPLLQSIEAELRPMLYRDQIWMADYRRLRVIAVKQ